MGVYHHSSFSSTLTSAVNQRGITKRAIAREFGITRTTVRRFQRQRIFRNVGHGGDSPSLIPFVSTWRSVGQRAATMRPNSAASCVSAAMADSEAGGRNMPSLGWRSHRRHVRSGNCPQPATGGVLATKPPMQRSPDEQCWVEAVTASHAQVATAR